MTPKQVDLFDGIGRLRTLEDIEHDVLRYALAHCCGNATATSRLLHIGRSTLYSKISSAYRAIARSGNGSA